MLNKETVLKVARLARLRISDSAAEGYQKQLEKVLENFRQIQDVDTSHVEPLVTPIPLETQWREDQVLPTVTAEELIRCAPDSQGNLYKVPPVV